MRGRFLFCDLEFGARLARGSANLGSKRLPRQSSTHVFVRTFPFVHRARGSYFASEARQLSSILLDLGRWPDPRLVPMERRCFRRRVPRPLDGRDRIAQPVPQDSRRALRWRRLARLVQPCRLALPLSAGSQGNHSPPARYAVDTARPGAFSRRCRLETELRVLAPSARRRARHCRQSAAMGRPPRPHPPWPSSTPGHLLGQAVFARCILRQDGSVQRDPQPHGPPRTHLEAGAVDVGKPRSPALATHPAVARAREPEGIGGTAAAVLQPPHGASEVALARVVPCVPRQRNGRSLQDAPDGARARALSAPAGTRNRADQPVRGAAGSCARCSSTPRGVVNHWPCWTETRS